MKKNISINLQGIIFHIEDDGYEVLSRYLQEVKAHFASYQGHEEIVADIEGRIAELFAARISPNKQVITLADVQDMTAKMGRVSDFNTTPDEDDEPAASAYAGAGSTGGTFGPNGPFGPRGAFGKEGPFGPKGPFAATDADGQPRRLYRDLAHRKIAGVCAGLAQYFMVNPLWLRLGFLAFLLLPNFVFTFGHWGDMRHNLGLGQFAFIAYVVLWIALPKRYDAPEPIDTLSNSGPLAGRKFYRDTDAGKVGGVSAGLAAYFNVDVTLIRVLFLATTLVGGTGFIIYIILWVVVPEARTVSEKMQMRGDAVTLSGIDSNLRSSAETDGPTGPNRPVGTFFENAAREARPAFSYVGRALRIVLGAFLLLIAGGQLIFLAMALGVALGIFPHDTVEIWDTNTRYMVQHDVSDWGKVAVFLVLGVPTIALLLLGLRLLLRRPLLSSTGSLMLLGLWVAGLVGSGFAIGQRARLTRAQAGYTTTRTFNELNSPGVVLDVRDQDDYFDWVRLRVAAADSLASVSAEQEFRAQGPTQTAARLTAQETILYNIAARDSTLLLDQGITLREDSPSRDQRLTVTLHLPLNRTYTLTPRFIRHLSDEDFADNRRPNEDRDFRALLTRQGKFRCLACPPNANEDGNMDDNGERGDDDQNNDDSDALNLDLNGSRMKVRVNTDGDSPLVSVQTEAARFNTDPAHYGSERKTLNDLGDFEEVEAHGAVRVVVRPGNERRVEAAGRPEDLRRLRLRRDGDRVVVRQEKVDFDLFSLGRRDSHAVLITVTVPRLRYLSLSGACLGDISGFDQGDELALEASGASALHVATNVPTLRLDLSGACRADVSGSVQQLDIDGNGSCQIEALDLRAARTKVELSGQSSANVRTSDELTVDLSGTSRVRYAGEPRVSQDLSGSSRLEQVKE